MAIKLDDKYNSLVYQEELLKATDLGFKGEQAHNLAVWNTALRMQYDAGELPEITVTPGVKRRVIIDSPKGNRVTYNDYQGRQNMLDALKKANLVGGILAVPAAGIAAAPIIAAGVNGYAAFLAAHPVLATGIDVAFTADGIRNAFSNNGVLKTYRLAKEGKYGRAALSSAGDVLDLAGTAQLINLGRKIANPLYRAGHAYVNISPTGYKDPFQRGKNYIKDLLTGKQADLAHTKWQGQLQPKEAADYLVGHSLPENMLQEAEVIAAMGREDAWRKYLGLPEKHGIYIKNPDGTYSYNLKKINDLALGKLRPDLSHTSGDLAPDYDLLDHGDDFITGAGGGLTGNTSKIIHIGEDGTKYGIQTITDTWDLHPFLRPADRIITKWWNKLAEEPSWKLRRRLNKWGEHIGVNEKELTDFYSSLSDDEKEFVDFDPDMFRKKGLSGKIGKWLYNVNPSLNAHKRPKLIQTLDNKVANFEVGPILGGKPFTMKTEIPIEVILEVPSSKTISPVLEFKYKKAMKDLQYEGTLDEFILSFGRPITKVKLNLKQGGKLNYLNLFKYGKQ